jgi:hypothetical protein
LGYHWQPNIAQFCDGCAIQKIVDERIGKPNICWFLRSHWLKASQAENAVLDF